MKRCETQPTQYSLPHSNLSNALVPDLFCSVSAETPFAIRAILTSENREAILEDLACHAFYQAVSRRNVMMLYKNVDHNVGLNEDKANRSDN